MHSGGRRLAAVSRNK